jgi:hypothetical protein
VNLMDAIKAEVKDWPDGAAGRSSREILGPVLHGLTRRRTVDDLADVSIDAVVSLLGGAPISQRDLASFMGVWCSAVLLGVRAAKRVYAEGEGDA